MSRTLAPAAALLAVLCATPSLLAEPAELLRDAFVNARADGAWQRAASLRSRSVVPDFDALSVEELARGEPRRTARALHVSLFPDTPFTLVLDAVRRDGAGSTVWTGRVAGDPAGSAVIAVNGGAMTVSIESGGRRFVVRPAGSGLHEAVEVDPLGFPADESETMVPGLPAAAVNAGSAADDAVTAADTSSQIDVFVAYTSEARQRYASDEAVRADISLAVETTNVAYENSGAIARLRLVGTAETSYDDTAVTFGTTLRRLTDPSDGFMDELHTLRNAVRADAVSLIVSRPSDDSCGQAWIMGSGPSVAFETYAFSVVRYDCAVNNYSLAHELGHNFGLQHDRANAGTAQPSYPYAYGYQDPQGRFRDIMAYNCPAGCPRLPYFSNPLVLYNGASFGVHFLDPAASDCVRALNNNAVYAANWRRLTSGWRTVHRR